MASKRLSFGVAGGAFTDDEAQYMHEKGLTWENSCGEILDISTDVEDVSFSSSSLMSTSQQHSLILFEENEKIYQDTEENRSPVSRPMSLKNALQPRSPAAQLSMKQIDETLDENEDDDKENEAGFALVKNVSPYAAITQEEARKVGNTSLIKDNSYQEEIIMNGSVNDDVDIVPCTQNMSVSKNEECDTSMDNVRIIPCTQTQDYGDDSRDEKSFMDISSFPGTQGQALDDSNYIEGSSFNISSVPCSQASIVSKESLDDTITQMTKLLALAEEEEAKEKLEAEMNIAANAEDPIDSETKNDSNIATVKESNANLDTQFKTPLTHNRVKSLIGKNICTPSPPRLYVDALLNRKHKKGTVVINSAKTTLPGAVHSSTPKRAPLTNVTPSRMKTTVSAPSTPTYAKKPVGAKVDSGLRRPTPNKDSNGYVTMSPVANYIYSKPAPSTFARVPGIPIPSKFNPTPSKMSISHSSSSVTKIPIPQGLTKPASTPSKEQKRHSYSNLKTSTFFDMKCTPPKIVSNGSAEFKRFQPLKYIGTSKVKGVDGKLQTPSPSGLVAHRHTGFRDVSGNASFIQSTFIQNQKTQPRLPTVPRI